MSAQNKKFRILFVDDLPSNVKILVAALEEEYDVVFADNGPDALKISAENPQPDIILLDIMMPRMNGYEVCRKLKSQKKTRHIPVMFVTALTEDEDEEKGLALGAVDYIKKPFCMGIVKSRIKTHLELKEHQDHLQKRTEELVELNKKLKKEIEKRKETEAMVQDHLGYLQQLIKENAFPSSQKTSAPQESSTEKDD